MPLDYRPDGISMWDTWYLVDGDTAHMFHLQNLAQDSTRDKEDGNWLGHATSKDLLHWTEQPMAIGPDKSSTDDDLQPWTGCMAADGKQFYFYFTMRGSAARGQSQRIGLALSDDLTHWTRYADNPVIVPDSRYYISYEHPLPNQTVDCRDLIVIPDPDQPGWIGLFAARIPGEEQADTSVMAAARSKDLIHWEQLPPAFAPGKYACLELPDVFFLDGRWYLTCLTGNRYGNRGIFSDPTLLYGTIYAVSDRPEGPYHEIEGDNVLLGGQYFSGYSCRSLVFEGERYTFYTQSMPNGLPETVSPPMIVRALPDGRLRLGYSDRTKIWRQQTLIEPGETPVIVRQPSTQFYWPMVSGKWALTDGVYRGEGRTGWQTADLGIGAANVEFEATVTLHKGVAVGIVYRPDTNVPFAGNDRVGSIAIFLDAEAQCAVAAQLPIFNNDRRQQFPVEYGKPYHLRVSIRPPRFELFIDDILVLQSAIPWPESRAPTVGLFVDRGAAEISDLALYDLGQ